MRRLFQRVGLALAITAAAVVLPAQAAFAFSDVPTTYWDYTAIKYVATTNTWMQDYGTDLFQPTTKESRSFLARSLVEIYAPDEPIDPTITFADLPNTDPFYPYANVAVKLGWMATFPGSVWNGTAELRSSLVDQALILAMGLTAPVAGLYNIKDENGVPYTIPDRYAEMDLARWLGLHYNHDVESLDMQQTTPIKRDEVAYSLWMAKTIPSWEIDGTSIFDSITLPVPGGGQQKLTAYALNQIGYPYIWGGEWNAKSPAGYCCGSQPQAGFDCSGFVWWVLKKYEDSYNSAQFRTYSGWSVHERVSSDMAHMAPTQLTYNQLAPGNLMFFASDGGNLWTDVDHVGIYLGNDWMMHSTAGGPQLEWVGSGWYFDNFVWGRALTSKGAPSHAPQTVGESAAGPSAVRP
jgi:cell wall-associated NlpC family hydrolase